MRFRRLRTRLMLTYTALIVLGFSTLAGLAGRQIAQGSLDDFAASLQAQASLVARSLKEDVEHWAEGETSLASISNRATSLSNQAEARLFLLDTRGTILYDSAEIATGSTFFQGPEVAAAMARGVSSAVRPDAEGINTLYAAAPVVEDGRVLAVTVLARPVEAARTVVRERWFALASGVLLLGLLAFVASIWLAGSLTRPLEQLRSTALHLAAGDLSQRVPETRADEFGQVASAFNHMADQVQAMLDEQRAFAANASHELRTPLTTIRLRSEALRNDTLDAETERQYVVEIDDEVARLGGLVEDLISLSRLDADRAERGHESVDVVRLARNVLNELATREAAHGRQLSLEAADGIPEVQASSQHLRVVLRNLLTNAVNYTPAGGSVVCHVEATDDAVLISVVDTGQGIAPEDLPHVFARFFRADKAHSRAVAGVGLGLALVKSIVDFYNGKIEIESEGVGQGTRVQVWWPVSQSEA